MTFFKAVVANTITDFISKLSKCYFHNTIPQRLPGFFSSRPTPPFTHPQASVAPPLIPGGGGHTRWGREGWGFPIRTRVQTLRYSMYNLHILVHVCTFPLVGIAAYSRYDKAVSVANWPIARPPNSTVERPIKSAAKFWLILYEQGRLQIHFFLFLFSVILRNPKNYHAHRQRYFYLFKS